MSQRVPRLFMQSEFMRPRGLIISSVVFGSTLLFFLIGGALGPTTYLPHVAYAYACGPEGDHVGNTPCRAEGGVMLWPGNETFAIGNLAPLSQLNQYFGVAMAPYSVKAGMFPLEFRVTVFAGMEQGLQEQIFILDGAETFDCSKVEEGKNRCLFKTILGVPRIEYPHYSIKFIVLNNGNCEAGSCPSDWLRDAEFEANTVNPSYTNMTLGMKTVGSVVSGILFCWYLIRMRDNWRPDISGAPDATLEQKFVLLLLLCLILDNDPFYGLRLVTQGWFLDSLATIFQVAFDFVLLLFWLGFADRTDRVLQGMTDLRYYIPKISITIVWAFLTFIALCWLRSRHIFDPHIEQDPVYMTQIYPMLIVTDILYFLIIVYAVKLMISTWEKINPKHYYLAFPTFVYIVSTLSGMFSGVTKDIEMVSIAFVYFLALRNFYTYSLLFGFWPIEGMPAQVSNPIQTEVAGEGVGETQRLISHGSQKNPFK